MTDAGEELVAVPRNILGAACAALRKKLHAPNTLAELNRYAVHGPALAIPSPAGGVREALEAAYEFLGGVDGASEVRDKLLSALSSPATPEPATASCVRYDEEPRVEALERDAPVVWRRATDTLEYALDIDTREIIGARIFLPTPEPALAGGVRRSIAMICMEIEDGRSAENVAEMFKVYEDSEHWTLTKCPAGCGRCDVDRAYEHADRILSSLSPASGGADHG